MVAQTFSPNFTNKQRNTTPKTVLSRPCWRGEAKKNMQSK